jgi:hypothetical protein
VAKTACLGAGKLQLVSSIFEGKFLNKVTNNQTDTQ